MMQQPTTTMTLGGRDRERSLNERRRREKTTMTSRILKEGEGEVPNTPYGHELQYIRTASKLTNDYFERLEQAAGYGGNSSIEYPDLNLAQQLKIVAQLIAGGLKSKVFVVRPLLIFSALCIDLDLQ